MQFKATLLNYSDTINKDSEYDTNEMNTNQYKTRYYVERCTEDDAGKEQIWSIFCEDGF